MTAVFLSIKRDDSTMKVTSKLSYIYVPLLRTILTTRRRWTGSYARAFETSGNPEWPKNSALSVHGVNASSGSVLPSLRRTRCSLEAFIYTFPRLLTRLLTASTDTCEESYHLQSALDLFLSFTACLRKAYLIQVPLKPDFRPPSRPILSQKDGFNVTPCLHKILGSRTSPNRIW